MTEQDWLLCVDPDTMLNPCIGTGRRFTNRIMRLFACACCRDIWPLFQDEASRNAVELAERFADGAATYEELSEAWNGALMVRKGASLDAVRDAAMAVTSHWAERLAGDTARHTAKASLWYAATATPRDVALGQSRAAQAHLLRDLIGNPFRPCPLSSFEGPLWRMPSKPRDAAVIVARTIYDERCWQEMLVLADTLEDCGITDPAILDHCRQPAKHARGCWLIDAILGKK
jgi:hypothetical protein